MMYEIELYSSEYGTEIFEYPTLKKAIAGFSRLVASSKRASKIDGYNRYLDLTCAIENGEVRTEP
jgi:hypothetical protein